MNQRLAILGRIINGAWFVCKKINYRIRGFILRIDGKVNLPQLLIFILQVKRQLNGRVMAFLEKPGLCGAAGKKISNIPRNNIARTYMKALARCRI